MKNKRKKAQIGQNGKSLKVRTLGLSYKLLASSFLLVSFSPALTKVKVHAQDAGSSMSSVSQSVNVGDTTGSITQTVDPGVAGVLTVTTTDTLYGAATDTQSGSGPNAPTVTTQPSMAQVDMVSGLVPTVPGVPTSPEVPSSVSTSQTTGLITDASSAAVATTTSAEINSALSAAAPIPAQSAIATVISTVTDPASPGTLNLTGSHTYGDGFSLDLSSSTATVAAPIDSSIRITIGGSLSASGAVVGGTEMTITPGQMITPSQFVALTQVIQNGRQNIILSANGAADGGGLTLVAEQTGTLSSLVLPQTVTLSSIGFGSIDPFSVSGQADISGSLFALQNTAATESVYNFGSLNITGRLTGDISLLPSYGTAVPSGGLFSSSHLTINTLGAFQNSGEVSSVGQLNISSGTTFANSGLISGSTVAISSLGAVTNSGSVMALAGNLNLNSLAGSFSNSGMLNAIAGGVNINTAALFSTGNILFDNSNGIISARDINFRSSLDLTGQLVSGKVDTTIIGGELFSQNLNIDSYGGTICVDVGNISGTVNSAGAVAHILTSGPELALGNMSITDDPTFYNTGGSVTVGNLNLPGQSLAIVARDNVTVNGFIRTSPGTQRGDVSIIAGAHFASPASSTGTQIGPNSTTLITVDGASTSGGKIQINNTITTGGGSVYLVAYAGTDPDSGKVNSTGDITTSGGSVTIYGESPLLSVNVVNINTEVAPRFSSLISTGSGTFVDPGTVDAQHNAQTGGAIAISGGSRVLGTISFLNGERTAGGQILAGTYVGGSITTGSLSGNAATVALTSGGSITAGNINVAGAGGITDTRGIATEYSYAQPGGQVTLSARDDISTGFIRAFGGGGSGGGGIYIMPEFWNGKAGREGGIVSIASSQGNITVNGEINVSGGGGGGGGAYQSGGTSIYAFAGGDGGAGGSVNVQSGRSGSLHIAGPILSASGGGGGVGTLPAQYISRGGAGGGSYGGGGGGGISVSAILKSVDPEDGAPGGGFNPGGDARNDLTLYFQFHDGGGGGGYFGSGDPGYDSSPFLQFSPRPTGDNFGQAGGSVAGNVSQPGALFGGGLTGADGTITLSSFRNIQISQTVSSALGPLGSGFSASPSANFSISAGTASGTITIRTGNGYIVGTSSSAYLNDANYGSGATSTTVTLSGTSFVTAGDLFAQAIDLNGQSRDRSDQLYAGSYSRGLSLSIVESGSTRNLSTVNSLTPAEYIALVQQISTGSQTIILSGSSLGTGAATGGSFTISSENLPQSGNFSGLVLPAGVTANVDVPVLTYENSALINGTFSYSSSSAHVLVTPNLTVNGSIYASNGITIYDSLQAGVGANALNIGGTGSISAGSVAFVNLDGSVIVNGSVNIPGAITIAAAGDITVNRNLVSNSINLIAGAALQQGSQPNTFIIGGGSETGGAIITGTNSLRASFGNIGLLAYHGTGTNSGSIKVGSISTGSSVNGDVSIIAGAPEGNAVDVGDINTSSTFLPIKSAGNIYIAAGSPVIDGTGTITYTDGLKTSGGNATVPLANGGAINTGNLTASGHASSTNNTRISIYSGRTVDTGNINVAGLSTGISGSPASAAGHLNIVATGNITVRSVSASPFGAGSGGSVLLYSGANVNITGSIPSNPGVSINATGTGGSIDIKSGNGAPSLVSINYLNDANYGTGASATAQANIVGSTITNAGSLIAGNSVKLNDVNQGTNVSAGTLSTEGSITITEGGTGYLVRSSDLVTPAEFIALVQIATTGTQSIVLDGTGPGTGFATGGSFTVQSANLPAVGNFAGLVLPSGVTGTVNTSAITYENFATVNGTLNLNSSAMLITPVLSVSGTVTAQTGNLNIQGNGPNNSLQVSGNGTLTSVNGNVLMNGSNAGSVMVLGSLTFDAASGAGIINLNGGSAAVDITANMLSGTMSGAANTFSISASTGDLKVGDVSSTGVLSFTAGSVIRLESGVTVSGSKINLTAPSLILSDGARLETTGAAALGGISVQSNASGFGLNVVLASGSQMNSTDSSQGTISFNSEHAGDVFINSGASLTGALSAGSNISFGGGQVEANLESITGLVITQGNSVTSASFATASGDLAIGNLSAVGSLSLVTGAGASALNIVTNATATGSSVSITTNQLNLGNGAKLSSTTGEILIDSHGSSPLSVNLLENAVIQSAGALNFNTAGATTEGAISINAGALGTIVQGTAINYKLGANALLVNVGNLVGSNRVMGTAGNATGISLKSQIGTINIDSALNTSNSSGDGGIISIIGRRIDLGGHDVTSTGGGATGHGGTITLQGSDGILGGGNIVANGSGNGIGTGGTISIDTVGSGNVLVKTLQTGGGALGGNGGAITSNSFNLSVIDVSASGESIFAAGTNGGSVSITTRSTNPFVAGNPFPNGTASGINTNGTGGSGGTIRISSDGVFVTDAVTVSADGTGAGGLITFDMNNPANINPQISVNGTLTAQGASPGVGTGSVGFGTGPGQNLSVNLGLAGSVTAGAQLVIGNIDPVTGQADGPAAGALFVAPALFGANLEVNGTLTFPLPVFERSTQTESAKTDQSVVSLNTSTSQNQNVQFSGQRTPVDLTSVFDTEDLSEKQEEVMDENDILSQTESSDNPLIDGISLFNFAPEQSQGITGNKRAELSVNPDSGGIRLSRGNLLLTTSKSLTVDTPLGQLKLPAGVCVFVMVSNNSVAIFDLHQSRQDAVKVLSENKLVSLNPGSLLVLTNQTTRDFENVQGQFQLIGHRGVTEENLSDDVKAFAMDFSLPSAFANLGPLKELLNAESGPNKQLADKILKNSALLAELTRKAGPYQSDATK